MIINTIERQQIAPLQQVFANYLWKLGKMLRTQPGKRFSFSTQFGFGVFPVTSYIMEVFPPDVLSQRMQQCRGDTPESDSQTKVGFIATITTPGIANTIPTEITLKSELRGIYARESVVPNEMICIRNDPTDTVMATLNKALKEKSWYPAY